MAKRAIKLADATEPACWVNGGTEEGMKGSDLSSCSQFTSMIRRPAHECKWMSHRIVFFLLHIVRSVHFAAFKLILTQIRIEM